MSSMAKRLAKRTRRRTFYDVVLTDPTPDEQAEWDAAEAELRLARLRHGEDSPEAAAVRPRHDAAKTAMHAHVMRLTFEGIPEHEFDELRSSPECAVTAEQLKQHEENVTEAQQAGLVPPGPPDFNPDAFMARLFARCVIPDDGDEPMTVAEWEHELRPSDQGGMWLSREKDAAFTECVNATLRPRSVAVPFV